MTSERTLSFVAAAAWLLATSQAFAADTPAAAGAKPLAPPLVLVPEPRPAPMPTPVQAAPKAFALPSAAAFSAPARPAAAEILHPMPSERTHTVAAGEGLDRVIQKTMADSPLKVELIRQAFIQLNPQAFPDGRAVRLRAGTVLQVPDAAQLLRSVLLPVLEGAEAAAVARNGIIPQAADEKRRWVRFP